MIIKWPEESLTRVPGALTFWRCRVCSIVKTPPHFQHRCHPYDPIFFFNRWLSLNKPLFFLLICHPKPMILCTIIPFKVGNSVGNSRCFCGTETALIERPKITFSPNAPIILDQNVVSHPMTPHF